MPAQENQLENYLKEFKENLFKQMNLAPEKERAFRAVEDKHAAARQKIIAPPEGCSEAAEDMVAAGKPENKTKMMGLVHAVTEAQDKLFASYRTQRNEELALLTPEQKAKYLVTMINWRHELMQKAMQGEGGQGMGQTPPSMGKDPAPHAVKPEERCRSLRLPNPRQQRRRRNNQDAGRGPAGALAEWPGGPAAPGLSVPLHPPPGR